jgi:hypothetical protein
VYQNTVRGQLSLDRTSGCIKSGFQASYLEGERDFIAKMFSRHSAREQVGEAAEAAPNRFFQAPHADGMGYAMPRCLAGMREVKAEGGWGVVCTG